MIRIQPGSLCNHHHHTQRVHCGSKMIWATSLNATLGSSCRDVLEMRQDLQSSDCNLQAWLSSCPAQRVDAVARANMLCLSHCTASTRKSCVQQRPVRCADKPKIANRIRDAALTAKQPTAFVFRVSVVSQSNGCTVRISSTTMSANGVPLSAACGFDNAPRGPLSEQSSERGASDRSATRQ